MGLTCCRYMSQGAPQFSDNLSVLHERYEDLLCAMDMVGFTDEVAHC